MNVVQYALLFGLGSGAMYLAFYRFDVAMPGFDDPPAAHVEVPLLVAVSCWSVLAASPVIEVATDTAGDPQVFSNQAAQGLALFLALLNAFAFVAALFGEFPTESMLDNSHLNDAQK